MAAIDSVHAECAVVIHDLTPKASFNDVKPAVLTWVLARSGEPETILWISQSNA